MPYKLGKLPAKNTVKLKLRDYLDWTKLPTPPANFGHETLVADWQMLGNDTLGDCAIAGPFHALELWNAEGNKPVNINTDCTVAAYSAITGYTPTDPSTDQGANVEDVAEYWRDTGLTDASNNIHKIDAFVGLEPGNADELIIAMYLFDGTGIGLNLPARWQQDFSDGRVWDTHLTGMDIEGGHYVLGVGVRNNNINVITWGATQLMTQRAYAKYSDEAVIYLDEDKLTNGKDLEGFNLTQLKADMAALGSEQVAVRPKRRPVKKESDDAVRA